jgi:very-short-patch-repair endonuclease
MTKEEYLDKYPGALLIDPDTAQKYSNANIAYFNTLSAEERSNRTYIRTEETINKLKTSIRAYHKNNVDLVKSRYTVDRAEKIRQVQLKRWSSIPKDERSLILKNVQSVAKSRLGEDKFNEIRRKNGSNALVKFRSKNNIKCASSFEQEMYNILEDANIKFMPQFEINGWFYDCYIPEKNLILEFDGDFWHPRDTTECKYDFQYKRLHTDKFKTMVAQRAGYSIVRIRESEKFNIYTHI